MIRRERNRPSQGRTAIMWVIVLPFLLSGHVSDFPKGWISREAAIPGRRSFYCLSGFTLLSYLLTIGLHQYIELLVSELKHDRSERTK